MTEDEMVGWHHRLNRHGFGWTPGGGEGQGNLAWSFLRRFKGNLVLTDFKSDEWKKNGNVSLEICSQIFGENEIV